MEVGHVTCDNCCPGQHPAVSAVRLTLLFKSLQGQHAAAKAAVCAGYPTMLSSV